MSGPKVVRIITREEILAICAAHLRRLDRTMARWHTQARKLGQLTEAEYTATAARHRRLHALLEQDRFDELQRSVPAEIEYLRGDLLEREERAILLAAEKRQRQRRARENAAVLLQALQARAEQASPDILQALSLVAEGIPGTDTESLLAQGYALLGGSTAEESLSDAQRALAQQLKAGDAATPSLMQWIAQQQPPRDERLQRIDGHIAELQLLQNTDAAEIFIQKLDMAESESHIQTRNMLLDSLVLDLAEATRHHQQQRTRLQQLGYLAGEVAELNLPGHSTLLAKIAACTAERDTGYIDALIEECKTIIASHLQSLAALARRQAVLEGLASLGYEVRENMATVWAEDGRIVLRKSATPGVGVEVGGKAESGRLQVRPVALSRDHDARRDRDIETIWCGEFQRLQQLLRSQGNEMLMEQARKIGEVAVKVIAESEESLQEAAATRADTDAN